MKFIFNTFAFIGTFFGVFILLMALLQFLVIALGVSAEHPICPKGNLSITYKAATKGNIKCMRVLLKNASSKSYVKKAGGLYASDKDRYKVDKFEKLLAHININDELQKDTSFTSSKTSESISVLVKDIKFDDLKGRQQKFLDTLIDKTYNKSKNTINEAAKKNEWIIGSNELCKSKEFDAFGYKSNWYGYLSHIIMNDYGNIIVHIDLRIADNSVAAVVKEEKLKEILMSIRTGSLVQFSGYFVEGNRDQNECLNGGVWFDSPELYSEEFTFKIDKIKVFTDKDKYELVRIK